MKSQFSGTTLRIDVHPIREVGMNAKNIVWIIAPLALSAGVIWLSAQAPQTVEGVKMGELAEKVQAREKAVTQKESELRQMEERLATLQGALEKDRNDLQTREKTLQDASAKLEALRTRPPIDPQIIRTYENMDPVAAWPAVKELAGLNVEVCVSLLAGMQAKKAAHILDQSAPKDSKLAAALSEKVGITRPKE
jgi:flagellar motility protein MotE (MotC chaperone)